ncbi:unnamed protein product [Larinioides sclopetarius]|uniref:Glucose-methanol-choline oxidoreductase C-terminal domain-containing protein n=1 Tax=Larinioides sclopetarius TaxID=280406 RepID=A0AAV1YV23_9ARAC
MFTKDFSPRKSFDPPPFGGNSWPPPSHDNGVLKKKEKPFDTLSLSFSKKSRLFVASWGPLVSPELVSAIAFLNGDLIYPEEDFPDHELYFLEISKRIAKDQLGLIPLFYDYAVAIYEDGPIFACISHLLHPKSRGTVRLQSTNPYDPPLIDPNYFAESEDLDAIVKGMETCWKIGLSKPMKNVGVKPFATFLPGFINLLPDFIIKLYFRILGRSLLITLSHQVGTAKMGDPEDPTTVVDPQLRVKGIQGLRVIDASIMPLVPSGNTNIPTIMVAEKASDMIKETISCKSD